MTSADKSQPVAHSAGEGPKEAPLFDNQRPDDLGLMTMAQVAAALGVAPATVKHWVARREIPFVPIGGPKKFRTMFNRDSIRAWLLKREYKPRGYR